MAHSLPSGVKARLVFAVVAKCSGSSANLLSVADARRSLASPDGPAISAMRRKCPPCRSKLKRGVSMNAQLYTASPPERRTVCTMPSPSNTCVACFGGHCAAFGPMRMKVPAMSRGIWPDLTCSGTWRAGATGSKAPPRAEAQPSEPSTSCKESSHSKAVDRAPSQSFCHSLPACTATPEYKPAKSSRRPGCSGARDTLEVASGPVVNWASQGAPMNASTVPLFVSRVSGWPL
mmetsp:Transcript_29167/g.88264  ORF Transcript_29167/g.88264 Transcript_29167/m.88264 type:complete len:233 (-) Transcript_29167:323-1021(-)